MLPLTSAGTDAYRQQGRLFSPASTPSKRTVFVAIADCREPAGHVECVSQEASNAIVNQEPNVGVGQPLDGIGLFLSAKDFRNLAVAVGRRGGGKLKDWERAAWSAGMLV